MKRCSLCNEIIEEIEFEFDEAIEVDGEFWHVGCYEEYFGETPEVPSYSSTSTSASQNTTQSFYQKNTKQSRK